MSNWYKKGRGRMSSVEKATVSQINDIIEEFGVDISYYEAPTTPNELNDLKDGLIAEFGQPKLKKDKFPESKNSLEEAEAEAKLKAESNSQDSDIEQTSEEFELEENKPADNIVESSKTDAFEITDFEEVNTPNPFAEEFKKEDMYKVSNFTDPEPLDSQIDPVNQIESVPNAWDIAKTTQEKPTTLEINSATPISPETTQTPEEKEKVKLAKKTGKVATENIAKQGAKIFEFITEIGIKKYSKISDKHLEKLEEQDLIDRNFIVKGKTVSELIEEHNDLIDELIKTDPEMREELIEALMLVAEKHQIEMSPESNLAMVVITMLLTLGKAGYDQKKAIKKLIKKVSDQYTLGKHALSEANERNKALQQQLDNVKLNNERIPLVQTPETEPVDPAPIKELSFGDNSSKPSLGLNLQPRSREIVEEESILEEITSEVSGDVKRVKK